MSDVQTWLPLASPEGEIAGVAAVLALSFAGPPWLGKVGRDSDAPSLIDRWALFSFLHPFWATFLRWTAAASVAVAGCALLVHTDRHDLSSRVQQAARDALHRAWKRD